MGVTSTIAVYEVGGLKFIFSATLTARPDPEARRLSAGPGHTVLKYKSVAEISLGQIRDFTVVNFISRNLESSRAAGIFGWSTKKAEGRILKPFEWDYL